MAGDIRLSGYKATESSVAWTSGQALNSASDDEWTDLSDEVDNSSNLYAACDLHVVLASAAFTGSGSQIEAYIVPTVDGTNYPNWTGNVTSAEPENGQYWVATLATSQATEAQRIVARNIGLPNGKFKWAFRNTTGVALAASGNTAAWRPHQTAYT